jgi:hypothetical protein
VSPCSTTYFLRGLSLIPAPPLPIGLTLQGGKGKRFGRVHLVRDAPAPADASPKISGAFVGFVRSKSAL